MTKSSNQKRLDLLHEGRAAECITSSRYLFFGKPSQQALRVGHPVTVDVMLNSYGEKPDRKLCELVMTVEAIDEISRLLRSEISAEDNSIKAAGGLS